jgi:hypothetical protein
MRFYFLLVFVVGCAIMPSRQDKPYTSRFEAPFDDAWSALEELFRELDLPIETLDKASGRMETGWFGLDPENDLVDCGRQAPGDLSYFSGKIDVEAMQEDEVVVVDLTSTFRASMLDPAIDSNFEIRCYSTGSWETLIFAHLEERIGRSKD